jgi:hypothetical protein
MKHDNIPSVVDEPIWAAANISSPLNHRKVSESSTVRSAMDSPDENLLTPMLPLASKNWYHGGYSQSTLGYKGDDKLSAMAAPIGIVSGIVALGTFAFQSSVALFETINSYQSHQKSVRDLAGEAGSLSEVLGSLVETVRTTTDLDLSALELPLRRCGRACKEFEQDIQKISARSGGSRANFRDWARLRYMGEDVDGFRRLLASYKMTITIALTDANLYVSA